MQCKLDIELVPRSAWNQSLYNYFKNNKRIIEWNKIKNDIFLSEGRKCWICGAANSGLEAHEFWEYDETNGIQKLLAIHHLCSMCHKIKHIGFWGTEDGLKILEKYNLSWEDIIKHFCRINECTIEDFQLHKKKAFEIWGGRNKLKWKQDFGKYQDIIKEK